MFLLSAVKSKIALGMESDAYSLPAASNFWTSFSLWFYAFFNYCLALLTWPINFFLSSMLIFITLRVWSNSTLRSSSASLVMSFSISCCICRDWPIYYLSESFKFFSSSRGRILSSLVSWLIPFCLMISSYWSSSLSYSDTDSVVILLRIISKVLAVGSKGAPLGSLYWSTAWTYSNISW